MNEDRARLLRLRRLETIRTIARQSAAREAAEAESTLAQLRALSDRTARLAGEYLGRRDAADGGALRSLRSFSGGLAALTRNAGEDALRAEAVADAKLRLLGEAERRRAAVEERIRLQERTLGQAAPEPSPARRTLPGTALE